MDRKLISGKPSATILQAPPEVLVEGILATISGSCSVEQIKAIQTKLPLLSGVSAVVFEGNKGSDSEVKWIPAKNWSQKKIGPLTLSCQSSPEKSSHPQISSASSSGSLSVSPASSSKPHTSSHVPSDNEYADTSDETEQENRCCCCCCSCSRTECAVWAVFGGALYAWAAWPFFK